jgi:hypothetical protein
VILGARFELGASDAMPRCKGTCELMGTLASRVDAQRWALVCTDAIMGLSQYGKGVAGVY